MTKILLALTILIGLMVPAMPASAFNVYRGADCGQAADSAVCTDNQPPNQNPLSGDNGLLLKITNIVAYVGGAAAVIMIIVASIRFITSGSDISTSSRTDTDVEDARKTIANALIGLAVIALARTIIVFVVHRL